MGVRAICTRMKEKRLEKRIQKRDKLWGQAKDKLEKRWLSNHRRPPTSQLNLGLDLPHRIQLEELFEGYKPDCCPYSVPRSIKDIVEKEVVHGYSYTKSGMHGWLIKYLWGLGIPIWLGSLLVPGFLMASKSVSGLIAAPIMGVSWLATSYILLQIDNKIEKNAIKAFSSWFSNADSNNSFISSHPKDSHEHSH